MNPMPDGTDDEVANSLADYFNNKTLTIRKLFENMDPIEIKPKDILQLRRFSPFSEAECLTLVNSLKPKSCKLDPIPSVILKRMLPAINPYLTAIVNKSLGDGIFC